MVDIEKTAAKPQAFMRLHGISYASLSMFLGKAEVYIKAQKQVKPIGRRASIDVANQLLLTLVYLRQYITFLSLGHQFGISESYAYKRYCFMRHILMQVLDLPDSKQLSLQMLTDKVGLDVSEQPIERPLQGQRQYYSGKKKTYSKGLVSCLPVERPGSGCMLPEGEDARFCPF